MLDISLGVVLSGVGLAVVVLAGEGFVLTNGTCCGGGLSRGV